jgi:hypothetical protein
MITFQCPLGWCGSNGYMWISNGYKNGFMAMEATRVGVRVREVKSVRQQLVIAQIWVQ